MCDHPDDTTPRPSPGTDPTNPNRQENVGVWLQAEQQNERRTDEVGLTDRDRVERDPSV